MFTRSKKAGGSSSSKGRNCLAWSSCMGHSLLVTSEANGRTDAFLVDGDLSRVYSGGVQKASRDGKSGFKAGATVRLPDLVKKIVEKVLGWISSGTQPEVWTGSTTSGAASSTKSTGIQDEARTKKQDQLPADGSLGVDIN